MTVPEDPRIERVLAGRAVVANVSVNAADRPLVKWAQERGLLVYVGRRTRGGWPQSPWHNPFKEGRHGSRDEVIVAYREYLEHSPGLKANLRGLAGKVLGCWCAPKRCHADILCERISAGMTDDFR